MAWYEELFSDGIYKESGASSLQVDCVIDALSPEAGCGQGLHLLDLAKRGYDVVGLDLSEYTPNRRRAAVAEEGVDSVLVHANLHETGFTRGFDAVINTYTSFGYLESPDEEQKALNAASLALRGGGFYLGRDPVTARRVK